MQKMCDEKTLDVIRSVHLMTLIIMITRMSMLPDSYDRYKWYTLLQMIVILNENTHYTLFCVLVKPIKSYFDTTDLKHLHQFTYFD